jgi:hypothetical protein
MFRRHVKARAFPVAHLAQRMIVSILSLAYVSSLTLRLSHRLSMYQSPRRIASVGPAIRSSDSSAAADRRLSMAAFRAYKQISLTMGLYW